jgi:hypothetical protein
MWIPDITEQAHDDSRCDGIFFFAVAANVYCGTNCLLMGQRGAVNARRVAKL